MTSATTVGNAVKISTPTYSWERIGGNTNEGPGALCCSPNLQDASETAAAMLYYGGRTFLVYSASACVGTGYELGRLELTGSDPLVASSWTKYASPIFNSANGSVFAVIRTGRAALTGFCDLRIYQPGHNGFFNDAAGNIFIVYHANSVSPGLPSHFPPRGVSESDPWCMSGTCDGARFTMVQPVYWHTDGQRSM